MYAGPALGSMPAGLPFSPALTSFDSQAEILGTVAYRDPFAPSRHFFYRESVMKIVLLALLAAGALLFTGCEEWHEHHHDHDYRGGAYDGYNGGWGHGEYRGYPGYNGYGHY